MGGRGVGGGHRVKVGEEGGWGLFQWRFSAVSVRFRQWQALPAPVAASFSCCLPCTASVGCHQPCRSDVSAPRRSVRFFPLFLHFSISDNLPFFFFSPYIFRRSIDLCSSCSFLSDDLTRGRLTQRHTASSSVIDSLSGR